MKPTPSRSGSIELVVLGLIAALIVLLAIPVFTDIDRELAVNNQAPQKRTPPAAVALQAGTKNRSVQVPARP